MSSIPFAKLEKQHIPALPSGSWEKKTRSCICQWFLLIQPGVPASFREAGSSSDADTAAAKKPSTKNVPKRGAKTVKGKGKEKKETQEESEQEQEEEDENKGPKPSSEEGDAKTKNKPRLQATSSSHGQSQVRFGCQTTCLVSVCKFDLCCYVLEASAGYKKPSTKSSSSKKEEDVTCHALCMSYTCM